MRSMAKSKSKKPNHVQVIIPVNHPNPPESHEVDTAMVLARNYQSTVEFILPVDDYKRKSADVAMQNVEWELKCPIGSSQSTIQNLFRRASKQAKNIIIDTRRTKLEYEIVRNRVLFEMKKRPYVKRVILIDKFEKVVEISK